jgi:hypothetical protein
MLLNTALATSAPLSRAILLAFAGAAETMAALSFSRAAFVGIGRLLRVETANEQTATVFLVSALVAAQKRTLQLLNSIEKGPMLSRTGLFEACGVLLPQITPDCASQEWCADFRRGWDFRGLNRPSKWLRSFDPGVLVCVNSYPLLYRQLARMLRGCEFRSSKSSTHGTGGRRGQCQRPDQLRQRDAANHVGIPRYQARPR